MYVNKKTNTISLKPGFFACIRLTAHSVHVPGLSRITLYAYRYPCGRIKLVAFGASLALVGKWGCDVVFDSVRSLYSVPGVHVYTNPYAVYTLLDMVPYACK